MYSKSVVAQQINAIFVKLRDISKIARMLIIFKILTYIFWTGIFNYACGKCFRRRNYA